jgi:leucyl-tRNA synthetase
VPEKDLPVTLPEVENYVPSGTGESPLAALEDWVKVNCPSCEGEARRETNTMPQWAGSSWYWLRYPDAHNASRLAAPNALRHWLPVDTYIGGAEHAVLHLLYARFWNMVLHDSGVVPQEEPFPQLRNVGLLMGPDGQKMSKSRGNVIRPDDVVGRFGSDVVRVYEMFMGPFDGSAMWSERGIEGAYRFLRRIWQLYGRTHSHAVQLPREVALKVHRTIQKVTESTEGLHFNTAISALMELLNELEKQPDLPKDVLEVYLLLLTPYAPHMCEELWQDLGSQGLISQHAWPQADRHLLASAQVTIPVQVNGRLRGTLEADPNIRHAQAEQLARSLPNVARYLREGTVIKVIYIPAKVLNFVIKPGRSEHAR